MYVVIVMNPVVGERWGHGKFDCVLDSKIFKTAHDAQWAIRVAREQDGLSGTKYDYIIYPVRLQHE